MRVCIAFEYGYLLKQQLSRCEGENITFEFQSPDIHITWRIERILNKGFTCLSITR